MQAMCMPQKLCILLMNETYFLGKNVIHYWLSITAVTNKVSGKWMADHCFIYKENWFVFKENNGLKVIKNWNLAFSFTDVWNKSSFMWNGGNSGFHFVYKPEFLSYQRIVF